MVAAVVAVPALGALFAWLPDRDQDECYQALQLAKRDNFAEAEPLLRRVYEQ
jgi:hypothetical protein